jgi:hypothetical protein
MTALNPAIERDVKRQVCQAYAADGLQPDEVIVNADGTVTIDARARKPWAVPFNAGNWYRDTAPAPPQERNTAMTEPASTGASAGTGPSYKNGDFGRVEAGTRPGTVPRPARGPAFRGPGPSGPWGQLASGTADYEPEDDSALLDWMAAEAAGMAGYGEALAEVYETVTSAVGVDPAALSALNDCADDVAQTAAAMDAARARFAGHYAEPREYAASGGVLPHDGRWVTGEGD